MTQDDLARSYLTKATKRLRVLDVLMEEEAWSDVVREFVPTDAYSRDDAERARSDARLVLGTVQAALVD